MMKFNIYFDFMARVGLRSVVLEPQIHTHLAKLGKMDVEFVARYGASDSASKSFDGSVLLVASVTVGNVPQMAVDLLLTSCKATHVGRLRAPALLPFVGCDESGSLVTAAELYRLDSSSERPTYVLQQRSPPSRGRAAEHANALTKWASAVGFVELVVLASANAAGRKVRQMFGSNARCVRGAWAPEKAGVADAYDAPTLEGCDENGVWVDSDDAPAFLPLRRKESFVRAALDMTLETKLVCSLLLVFAHEGDNTNDAAWFAALVVRAASLNVVGAPVNATSEAVVHCFVPPESWAALAPPPPGLY